jgi:hypothetical protein
MQSMQPSSSLSVTMFRKVWYVCAVVSISIFAIGAWLLTDSIRDNFLVQPLQSSPHSNINIDMRSLQWHIKPIKPLHEGKVVYVTAVSDQDDSVIYKRIFTAPCGDGMLVFNVGPAAEYEPYAYELYEDAYAYSNNGGLCVLYPSYRGIQTSPYPLWTAADRTEMTVRLGDLPNQISTRVVTPPHTKPYNHSSTNHQPGGDFLVIRSGNFYNPTYYKNLKSMINSWPEDVDDIPMKILDFIETTW